ncbi:unnamed protein product [Aureobasidium vineae]|uniref:Sulfotransferase family protein n=1 Tax=Aureobasidium vineae TaxID=2773715 RepID=A0A9N8J732_9PEZI|nr:unnamed protein product [Aureobasidium vineae]
MSNKPIFVATHPRACSTAFERKARAESGFENSTYETIFDNIMKENEEGKRIFIKDITHYLAPPDGKPASIAPSLMKLKRGVGTNGSNPLTDMANGSNASDTNAEILNKFHFAFLIRHPKHSIPSYWRCTIPPLDAITGFYNFMPSEAGYDEQRRLFDYLRSCGQIGPKQAGQDGEQKSGPDHTHAKEAFEKWRGFHEDAINSTELKPRTHKKAEKSDEQLFAEWSEKYGEEAAKIIQQTVADNVKDYEHMKQFAIKV